MSSVSTPSTTVSIPISFNIHLEYSDVPAILNYTKSVYYIGNNEMAKLTSGNATFYNLDGDEVEKELVGITFSAESAEKGGYVRFRMACGNGCTVCV